MVCPIRASRGARPGARDPSPRGDGRAGRGADRSARRRRPPAGACSAQNLVSRAIEREADWKALQTTRDPDSARGLFREFADTSLGDPSPPTWAYVLLQTHPTLAQRVAMANAWAARQRGEP